MNDKITWRLGNEKIGKLLISYAIPAVIGTTMNALFHIINRVFIGQVVGPLAISGIALTFPLIMFLQAFGMLVGAGAATRVSIFLGKQDNEMAEKVLGNALTLTFLIGIITIIPSMIFMEDLLVRFGGSEQTIPYAKDYLYISIPGNLLAALSFGFNSVMRASGYPFKAMWVMIGGAAINIFFDWLFIYVFGWGIKGAASATIIAMTVTSCFVMSHFLSENSLIRFRKKYLKLNLSVVLSIFAIGMSPFAMQLAGSLVNVIMNNALHDYGGDLAIGASGIINSVALLLVMLILGISQGMQPIVGYNIGAGNQKRAHDTLRLVIITATIITTIGSLVSFLIPDKIVRLFTTDPELLGISANGLAICLSAGLVFGSQIVISQFFQSIGMAWKAMFLTLSRQCLYLIPLIIVLPSIYGLDGVWLAMPLSDFVAAISAWAFLLHYFRSSKAATCMKGE